MDAEESYRIRLHRARSWLRQAEAVHESDPDGCFIFLWIAFNAAYARQFGEGETERKRLRGFIDGLLQVDTGQRLHALVMQQFSGPIRCLIGNRFVFEPFWQALRAHDASDRWQKDFAAANKQAMAAVLERDTARVYDIVLARLYVLRNQLVHGGATHGSRVNRQQLMDANRLMRALVAQVIELMAANPGHDWGEILYPPVGEVAGRHT